ncbi:calcineurin-like phosphoesterase [Aureococcus anophagefferens]|nr:calcineurin-like phosphoesterase [Aureococcus anophagefferens]
MASNVGRAGLRAEDSVEIHGCVVDATRPGEAWERLVAYSAHRYPASALHDGGDGAPPGKVRWVFLSDTCGLHHAMADVPNGDVLVHCGNFSTTGSVERTREFVEWFAGHPHRRKVLVAGNHDTSLDADFYDAHWRRLHPTRRDDAALREALRSDGRFAYLEHASATVLGYEVFGSPHTSDAYGNWAFHYDRGPEAAKLWAAIPPSTDVLVTHAPPLGVGDAGGDGAWRRGCAHLLQAVLHVARPVVHAFGSMHEAAGCYRLEAKMGDATVEAPTDAVFLNASICGPRAKPSNPCVVVDLPDRAAGAEEAKDDGLGVGRRALEEALRARGLGPDADLDAATWAALPVTKPPPLRVSRRGRQLKPADLDPLSPPRDGGGGIPTAGVWVPSEALDWRSADVWRPAESLVVRPWDFGPKKLDRPPPTPELVPTDKFYRRSTPPTGRRRDYM